MLQMAGAEVHHVHSDFDLIVVTPNQTMLSVEVKSAFKPHVSTKHSYQFKVGSAVVDFYVFLAVDIERLIVRRGADVRRGRQAYFNGDEFSEEAMSSGIDLIIGS
jgi:hypothetical protein